MTVVGLTPGACNKTRWSETLQPRTGNGAKNGTVFAFTFAVKNQ